MSKEVLFLLIRSIMTAIGSFMFGKSLFGLDIDPSVWETVVGVLLTVSSVIWGIVDKSLTIEMWESALRQVFVFVGGIMVAIGKFTPEQFAAVLGAVVVVGNVAFSIIGKKKSQRIVNGKISEQRLKKLSP